MMTKNDDRNQGTNNHCRRPMMLLMNQLQNDDEDFVPVVVSLCSFDWLCCFSCNVMMPDLK